MSTLPMRNDEQFFHQLNSMLASHRAFVLAEQEKNKNLIEVASCLQCYTSQGFQAVTGVIADCCNSLAHITTYAVWAYEVGQQIRLIAAQLSAVPARALLLVADHHDLLSVTWQEAYGSIPDSSAVDAVDEDLSDEEAFNEFFCVKLADAAIEQHYELQTRAVLCSTWGGWQPD